MFRTILSLCLLTNLLSPLSAQPDITVMPGINLPKDSVLMDEMLSSLNAFIHYADSSASYNPYIAPNDKVLTRDLTDEFAGIEKSTRHKNDHFYKPCLLNVTLLEDSSYFVQISFIGNSNDTVLVRANFELLAYRTNGNFVFSSPVSFYTRHWNVVQVENLQFHCQTKLNLKKAKELNYYLTLFDKKLGIKKQPMIYYCCKNAVEALHILGVSYKSDFSGRRRVALRSSDSLISVAVTTEGGEHFDDFDPHDLWHDRLRKVAPASMVNRPIDEGCAYLYGGSWGISWATIFNTFKLKVAVKRETNWLDKYNEFYNFGDSKEKHLIVEYVINALLVQKIEKEKGFGSVLEFAKCGKYEKTNEQYFASLEKITGITRSSFNEEVWKLIDQERP